MIITQIQQAKKRESRVNLFLDGEFWVSVNKNDLIKLGLHKDKMITEEEKKIIEDASNINKVIDKALNFISIRPRSTRELKDYLVRRKDVEESQANEVIEILQDKKYLSDLEFTKWFIKARLGQKKYGINKIKADLAKKGISNDIFKEALGEFDYKEDNIENIKELIKKFTPKIKAKDQYEFKNKLMQKLAARGFSFDEISKAIKNDEMKE
jgi:regulatory protein